MTRFIEDHDRRDVEPGPRTFAEGRRRVVTSHTRRAKAKFPSRLACGHEVKAGDQIATRGNGWMCESCAEVTTGRA